MLTTQDECLALLEQLRWQGIPKCPYCESCHSISMKRESRYHCGTCFTSYSVTVGTLFHKTHIELPKWFQAICIVMNDSKSVSVRKLAARIDVNKNTAAYMLTRIHDSFQKEPSFLKQLYKAIETDIPQVDK